MDGKWEILGKEASETFIVVFAATIKLTDHTQLYDSGAGSPRYYSFVDFKRAIT